MTTVADTWVHRPRHVLVQYSHYSLDCGPGNEPSTTASISHRPRCHPEGDAQREPEPVVQSGRASPSHEHAQQEPEWRAHKDRVLLHQRYGLDQRTRVTCREEGDITKEPCAAAPIAGAASCEHCYHSTFAARLCRLFVLTSTTHLNLNFLFPCSFPIPRYHVPCLLHSIGTTPQDTPIDTSLIEWANSHLPSSLRITDTTGPLCGGLALLRLAEDIKGKPSSPPVPDAAFPTGPNDDKLDGLFRLFDFLLDNDVKMGSVSINDIRQGKRDKIVQLLRALKAWEDRRRAIAQSLGKGSVAAGPFMGMAAPIDYW